MTEGKGAGAAMGGVAPSASDKPAAPSTADSSAVQQRVELDVSLRHMHGRSMYRRMNGAYDPARPGLSAALTVLLLVACLLAAVGWTSTGPVVVLSLQSPQALGGWGGLNILSSLLVVFLLIFLSHKVGRLESTALNILTAVFAALMVAAAIRAVVLQGQDAGLCYRWIDGSGTSPLQDLLVVLYLLLALVLVTVRGVARWSLPRLAASGCCLVAARVRAREDASADDVAFARGVFSPPAGYAPRSPVRAVVFEVVSPGWFMRWPLALRRRLTSICSYVGEVDATGRPSGYGEWRDNSYHGEHLRGFWDAGVPVGPFRSRETGSASSFVCLQFAITCNLGHAQVQPGLVAVEVSATGVFFHGLPRVTELQVAGRRWEGPRPKPPSCGGCAKHPAADGEALGEGPTNDIEAPATAAAANGDSISSDAAAKPSPVPPLSLPTSTSTRILIADLQQPVALPVAPVLEAGAAVGGVAGDGAAYGSEVFIFVHGLGEDFGNGHIRMFGQMMALLELPPHIAPLLFCWPAGVVSCYHPARYLGADDPRCHAALVAVLRQLAAQGVERVHIACHSMGTRVTLGAIPLLEAEIAAGEKLPALASATLLNPDYELYDFVKNTGPRLRRLCPIVTIYGDPADQALLLAEVANGATAIISHFKPTAVATSAAWHSLLRAMGKSQAPPPPPTPELVTYKSSAGATAARPLGEGREAGETEAPAADSSSAAALTSWWRRSASERAAARSARDVPAGTTEDAAGGTKELESGAHGDSGVPAAPRPERRSSGRWIGAGSFARRMGAGGRGADGGEDGDADDAAASAWRRAALAVALVADEAARMVGMASVSEWWAARPSRAGGRKPLPVPADGGLAHGMWRPKGRSAAALASRDDALGASRVGVGHLGVSPPGGAVTAEEKGAKYLSLGRRIYSIEAPPGHVPLDVDVVDLTCLAVNVPAHRHSVHVLNRDVLWDLHGIIARGERAVQRTRRLEKITSNVWSFKTSPAHVHVDLL